MREIDKIRLCKQIILRNTAVTNPDTLFFKKSKIADYSTRLPYCKDLRYFLFENDRIIYFVRDGKGRKRIILSETKIIKK